MSSFIDDKLIYNVTLVSVYENMTKIFKKISHWDSLDININTLVNTEKITKLVKETQNKTDVFLSRGATTKFIRGITDVPVVNISITTYDLIKCIYKAMQISKKIGILYYYEDIYEFKEIENMFNIKLVYCSYKNIDEIEEKIDELTDKGIDIIIGGGLTPFYLKRRNIKSILLESSKESIENSLRECLNIANIRYKEIEKNAKLKTILNSIKEGIIVTDKNNIITLYNKSAEEILKIKEKDALSNEITKIIPNTRMHRINESGETEIGELQDVNGVIIAANRVPIKIDDKIIGVVSSFNASSNIEKIENKLRKRAHLKGLIAKYNFKDILTCDEKVISLKEKAKLYSMTDGTILIEGESGTGKELFAQSIHNNSLRKNYPFVAVNCGAIPEQLLESELFGYEGGAFTGANKDGKMGLFELAHKGTIFLDEIGEMPKALQARLLRVIQEKEVMRVGGTSVIPIDIRIICATNKDLMQSVLDGNFREDLYYRLNVFNLKIPPLRERKKDISLIGKAFLIKYTKNSNLNEKLAYKLEYLSKNYNWPGNIRELDNIIRRIALLQNIKDIDFKNINSIIDVNDKKNDEYINLSININESLKNIVDKVEFNIIDYMLKEGYDMDDILEKLKISRATYMRKKSLKKEI
ncbi:sigma 54-interacting transcriptional regulator [Eubacterium multiforme]|uniref:Transcriptional regulator with PAS, ATPase and Fis domain n=1 Tax=Eubacterium multiforme TaxID=83339 RepID=A0ABT9UQT7_9FIRM|nr:sigma 54-interacting transcriptional regulator [Eubacterium multiforme]MDQ0149017.1 transcriptional regulator with PAS, ATPase and Fis domain [Eubacterium multiforme]